MGNHFKSKLFFFTYSFLLFFSSHALLDPVITFMSNNLKDVKRHETFRMSLQFMEERNTKVIVETGTMRQGTHALRMGWDGGFTLIAGYWCALNQAKLYSVDNDPQALLNAKNAVEFFANNVEVVENDSVHFLKNFDKKIDFLYLDSFNFNKNNPEASQQHHLREIEAAYDKLTPNSVVMIDDCDLPEGGSGKLVIDFLLKKDWKIAAKSYQVIMIYPDTAPYDLAVFGRVRFADGIGRQTIGIIDCLKSDVRINFINTEIGFSTLQDINADIAHILSQQNSEVFKSNVGIFEMVLSSDPCKWWYKKIQESCAIKIAYSMFEATQIIPEWVSILNDVFDAVVVPDNYLIQVYKKSGVTIPIFVLPLGIYIEEFLKSPQKTSPGKPFVFGISAAFADRKNHIKLLESFIQEFGNSPDVVLKIHGRICEGKNGMDICKKCINTIREKRLKNIQLINKSLAWHEYIQFISSFDCYVFISKGEGFSITPREALACGIPVILSNNTTHQTICKTGFVRSVPSAIMSPAYCEAFGKVVGSNFDCTIQDVRAALRDVYQNYQKYLDMAQKGREWVQRYLYKNLRPLYLNLVKPKKVILGDHNLITDEFLMTNSPKLYEKYIKIKPISQNFLPTQSVLW